MLRLPEVPYLPRRVIYSCLNTAFAATAIGAQAYLGNAKPSLKLAIAGVSLAVICLATQRLFRHSDNQAHPSCESLTGSHVNLAGFLTAIEQASECIVVTDATGTIQYVNPAFTTLTGYSPREVIGQNPRLLKSGIHDAAFYSELWRTIGSGRVWNGDIINRRKNGTLYTDHMSITPVRDDRGRIVNYIAIKQDSTARRLADHDRKLLSSVLNCSPDAIFAHTADGIILTWDRGAEMLFGYRENEVIARHVSMLFGPEFLRRLEGVPKDQDSFEYESVGIAKNLRRFPISVASSPIRGDAGDVVAFTQIVRDISQVKEAEQHRNLLAAIVESSEDAIVAIAMDGTILSWNHGAELIYGYSAEEALGRNVAILVPSSLQHRLTKFLVLIKAGKTVSHLEAVSQTKSGRLIDISVTTSVLRNPLREIVGVSAIARDITARRRAETALRQAMEAAQSATRAKSEFLANMSHEIRTPMNGVVGMTELLLKTDLSLTQRRFSEVIRESSYALLAVLDDILDFSKIEAGKLTLHVEEFDLSAVVDGTVDLFAVKAQQKGVELVCFIEPNVPTRLRGDPGRLRQILTNLLGNAVKFTDSGEVSIRVRRDGDGETGTLRIEVADTGTGVPADKQHMLFQPFVQADSSSSRRFTGTGLGLSIVQRLVAMMGGRVGFASEEGRGSRFWFTAAFGVQDTSPPAVLSLRGRRILLVVRRPAIKALLTDLLSLWQCEFFIVSDAAAASSETRDANTGRWDAVIVDLDSTDAHNCGSIDWTRQFQGTPVVLLIPSSWAIDEECWHRLGMVILAKPVKQSALEGCLTAALGLGSTPDPRKSDAYARSLAASRCQRADCQILVVEDSSVNQTVTLALLAHLGYPMVHLVTNGRQALDALIRADYDVVLMDCELPELDGYETTKLIRDPNSSVRNHSVVVIAMTAYALAGDRERCLAAGMNDYISKPVQLEVLERTLAFWVDGLPANPVRPRRITVPAAAGGSVFDPGELLDRLMNNVELAQRVSGAFIRETPSQLDALSQGLLDGDANRIRVAAHSLKGAAATIGGNSLREAAAKVETLASRGDVAAAETLIHQLRREAEALCAEVKQFYAGDCKRG